MKLYKYYSLDECHTIKDVLGFLGELEDDSKIEFEHLKSDEVIKIKNHWMNDFQKKELIEFFTENDVIEYPDFEEFDNIDDEDYEDYDDDEDDY
jgi:hypothetical protein